MRDPRKSAQRRVVLASAGGVGALAAAAVVLPGVQQTATPATTLEAQVPADSTAAGYRLTEHIKRYYASTRI
jgi:hypothetical protein